jgi:hypothetical protein
MLLTENELIGNLAEADLQAIRVLKQMYYAYNFLLKFAIHKLHQH